MKKLWIILILFAVMASLAVYETVTTTAFYRKTSRLLQDIQVRFVAVEEVDDADTLRSIDALQKHWESGKKLLRAFGNHTVVRNADEKIVALCEFARLGERSDATVSLEQAVCFIQDLRKDLMPSLTNLL